MERRKLKHVSKHPEKSNSKNLLAEVPGSRSIRIALGTYLPLVASAYLSDLQTESMIKK